MTHAEVQVVRVTRSLQRSPSSEALLSDWLKMRREKVADLWEKGPGR